VPEKSPLEKIQDAVNEAVADPEGTARKAAAQVRGALSLGFMVVGQVAQTVADRLMHSPTPTPTPPSAPKPPVVDRERPTPADVAKVVELKPAAAKKAPAKKAPAKKSATPSGKLPVKKAPAKAAPAKKAPAKKAPAKKAPAKKSPAAGTES
jgi:DNA-binding protein HU-beta